MIFEMIQEIIKRIEATEGRSGTRKPADQLCFEHAVHIILTDLWQSVKCIPMRECRISKRSGHYFENPQYSDPLLTYVQTIAVFDGLVKLGLIEVTQEGYFDPETLQQDVTSFIARDELLERLSETEGHPAISVQPNLKPEIIILRNTVDGKHVLQSYEDTPATEKYRSNLQKINSCFLKHWCDFELKDNEIPTLEANIANHKNKHSIDLSQRTLVRIFVNGSFKQGGRFHHGWWQNLPSDYRKYITIDEKRTTEFDFSQLSPHLLYFANHKELGSEDAYDRVLDGEHRTVVKQAFNAMIQASSPMKICPQDIDLTKVAIGWAELRDRIISSHKPIADLFFNGTGNHLQYQTSCVEERVMLQFAQFDEPALPVNDSFILRCLEP